MENHIKRIVALFLLASLFLVFACDKESTTPKENQVYGSPSIIQTPAQSILLKWQDNNALKAKVYYSLNESDYVLADNELICQESPTIASVNLLGLKSGTYNVKIVVGSNEKTLLAKNISVSNFDRSGYAHFNYVDGIGAYTNEGILKDNAKVLYVSDENKNSITYNGYVGIGAILSKASTFANPLCVRIIGRVSTQSWNKKDASYSSSGSPCISVDCNSQNSKSIDAELGITNLLGLSDRISIDDQAYIVDGTEKQPFDYSKYPLGTKITTFDSYFNMLDVNNAKNITLEGVVTNSEIYQWGISFKRSNSIEVRNLTFTNYPEDACSFYGEKYNPEPYGNFWVHNCVFNKGENEWDITAPKQRDKSDGDGSIDISGCHNTTISYCNFNNCHKTGLVGSADDNLQFNMTFHHNYYNSCSSRLPLARQANIHCYNNYYNLTKNSCMNIRANAYILSENNYFENCKSPISTTVGSACKSLGDKFIGCTLSNATVVFDREAVVNNTCIYGSNFDTDTLKFYYDKTNKCSKVEYMTDAIQAKSDCINFSGVFKANAN